MPEVKTQRSQGEDAPQRVHHARTLFRKPMNMRRTMSFAGIQITEESDEENDHEQDREQRPQLENNAEPSVEVTMLDGDSQNRN